MVARDGIEPPTPAFSGPLTTEVDQTVEKLRGELQAGDVVAIMSNGGFGGIHEKLLAAFA